MPLKPKAAKAKTAKAAAPRHPLARLKAAFGTKADLVAKIVERRWPFLIAGDQRADTSALGSDEVLFKCPSV